MRPKTISKRDGKFVSFDDVKIRSAIFRAANDVPSGEKKMTDVDIDLSQPRWSNASTPASRP